MAVEDGGLGVVDIRTRAAYVRTDNNPLSDAAPAFGGGGGGGPMDPTVPLKDYVDAADRAVETRLEAKLDKLPTHDQLRALATTVVAGVFGIVVAALAFLAFAGDRFDAGMSVSPTLHAVQRQQAEVDKRQDAHMNVMDQKLDIIIKQTAKN